MDSKDRTMNVSTASRRTTGRPLIAGVLATGLSTGLVATLLAATMVSSGAAPTRSDGESGGPGKGDTGRLVEVVCFNIPHHWNVSLDGPLPRCYRAVL
jgi:hypothetical protein